MIERKTRAAAGRRPVVAWCWAALLVGLPSVAAAQGVAFIDPPRGQMERTHEFDLFADGEFGGTLDEGGTFKRVNTGLRYATEGAVNRNIGLGASLGFTYDGYDFETSSSPTCAPTAACFQVPPWVSLYTMDVAPSAGLILGPQLQILAWVPMRFSLEAGATDSGFTGGIIGAVRFVFDDGRLATTLGVGFSSELVQTGHVFPVIGIDWQLGERWRFVTEGGPYEGGLVTLLFGPSKEVKLRISSGLERKRFRLSSSGDRTPNGVGEQRNVPLLFGFDLKMSDSLRLDVHGGMSLAGRMSIDDSSGSELAESDYDVAGRVGGSIEFVF